LVSGSAPYPSPKKLSEFVLPCRNSEAARRGMELWRKVKSGELVTIEDDDED
jgi:hypothetical protein